ncbi:hypothetical protein [Actinophytocola algeriensis]|uniref:Uncharacterized protein n=1 Tax=Actinophytocola algeriensis TaxID=1768010 RepID=A0A7W7VDV6_9PSEU|nr:hypothetical protein [Actinophytocola algeriensis]MBB4906552.1 hypothetical protein [Actinophytocola algeriensis]MBE1478033.1 hypothetical protein [Actinophytocola algeriensis]
MSADDPERLLSEALRAQATRAPADTSPVGYGLLSGSEFAGLTPAAPAAESATTRLAEVSRQIPAVLILLLSLVLGLAAGAVVGLLTLL